MAPQILYILFEHSTGYALFKVKEFEEIGLLLPQVEQSVTDLSRFNSIIQLISFAPFRNAANALDNMNCISEGIVHPDLKAFLETNVLKLSKKLKNIVGLADSKLSSSISEELGFSCLHSGPVPEIIRGIRLHAAKLIRGLTDVSQSKAQLGLGHSYSRAKVKFNVNRTDNMIIQSINLLDQLDKNINTFSMRIREWYGYHFPELVRIINDNQMYAKIVTYIGNRKIFTEDKLEGLQEIVMDDAKTKAIWDASRSSMGMDISPMDMINVEIFAKKVVKLSEYRHSQHEYLKTKMDQVAPNLSSLIGEQVGARLISHAGSLTNLAKYPASTVQILGAEKALFRALKTKGNTPKYGLIFHSSFIGRAAAKNKGRISRNLANKCSIASRIDCFAEFPTNIFGEHLREQVEERLKFYESGDAPRKNVDVMKIAIHLAHKEQKKQAKRKRKSETNEKQDKLDDGDAVDKPKKKRNKSEPILAEDTVVSKKKKQKLEIPIDTEEIPANNDGVVSKKKKQKLEIPIDSGKNPANGDVSNGEIIKKKKKNKLNKTQ